MKVFIWFVLRLGTLVFLLASGITWAGAGIVGGTHDFTNAGEEWNTTGEICRVCHVPHDHGQADQRYKNGLLWNHKVSAASYTMYDASWSNSIDNISSAQPDGTAKLCLGCHDGTIAIDAFDQLPGTITLDDIGYGGKIVTRFNDGSNLDLRGTHPISINYDPSVDAGLRPLTTVMGSSGTIADVLDNGKVQCSSCHDVHGQENAPGPFLLRVGMSTKFGASASGLCLTCHNK